jgi:hypothetical protein
MVECTPVKWQLPLCVCSVGGIDDNVRIAQVLEGDDLSHSRFVDTANQISSEAVEAWSVKSRVTKVWMHIFLYRLLTEYVLTVIRGQSNTQDDWRIVPQKTFASYKVFREIGIYTEALLKIDD